MSVELADPRIGANVPRPLSHLRVGLGTRVMHQRLSRVAIVGYSAVLHDNHVQATWCESDWCDRIQKCHVSKPQGVLNVYQILFPLEDGIGDKTSMHLNILL